MRPGQIREHLKIQPFRPIRVHISDGSSYDIRHPEMAYVTASQVMIALEISEDDLPDKVVFCDPVHIARIEPLDGAKPKRRTKRG
ncbi:MAG: hypothetical protein V3W34_14510 [Phycisphaerae bacterium]